MVMDSSYEGVRFRPVTWIYLYHEGYRAIRYDNVVEVDNPAGTLTNPRIIGSDEFPFVHDGNTRDVVCMEFDRYEVTPDPVHSGPEFVYELSMKTPGRVAITVTDVKGEGIDNDVHLLSSLARLDIALMATDCIASADQTISRELDKGLYYIVVDSKTDMPGEYTLTIDLE